ncbi:MAG TPA: acyltransferase [Edaphobacter sp.]|jgi:peptidoglycan/LPS O-acetylase OafA/YrhL|nr:acyltransferase [Edaphobacter sp.]
MQSIDGADLPVARFDGVDALRGLSILAVVLLHAHLRLFFAGHSIEPLMPRWLFEVLFTNGNNGVTVFFAVSGFLITFTSLRRFGALARMRVAAFYRIRFARIAPLLILTLAVLSLLHLMHAEGFRIPPSRGSLPLAVFSTLTFHLNWLEAKRGFLPANWDVLWSLSVEEMFYLFFPLACLLFLRWQRGTLFFVLALVLFIGMGPFARTVWTSNEIWQEKSYLGGMDGIALGCLTALLTERLQRDRVQIGTRLPVAIQIVGAALMVLIFAWPHWHWMETVGRTGLDGTILALGTCFVIFGSVLNGHKGRSWSEPIRWIGRRSYEIYLTHEFVVVWMTLLYLKLRRGPGPLWIAAIVMLSLMVGAFVARWFSEPMNRRLRGARIPSHQTEHAEQMV